MAAHYEGIVFPKLDLKSHWPRLQQYYNDEKHYQWKDNSEHNQQYLMNRNLLKGAVSDVVFPSVHKATMI